MFKKLGSDGERTFGSPVGIEKQGSLWKVLTQLDNVMSGSEVDERHGLEGALHMQSQASDITDRGSSPVASLTIQTAFATQIRGGKSGLDFETAPIGSREPTITKGASFLSLLNVPRESVTPVISSDKASNVTSISRTTFKSHSTSILQPVSETRKAEISTRLASKANRQSSVSLGETTKLVVPLEESSPPLLSGSTPEGSEKENDQKSLKEQVLKLFPKNEPVANADQNAVSDLIIGQISAENPFEGMKRVPRSYVQIPKNQLALLSSPDSWWRLESSSRASHANLPTEVVQELHSYIDRRQHKRYSHDIHKNRTAECSQKSLKEEERVESGSDEDNFEPRDCSDDEVEQSVSLTEGIEQPPDDESMMSWVESLYSSKCDSADPQAAPDSSLGDKDGGLDDMADENPPNVPFTLPSSQELRLSASNVPRVSMVAKEKSSYYYDFPSSSPGDDEELEMAVPYALDDQVEENNAAIDQERETNQELLPTVVGKQPMVQVEQTPGHIPPCEKGTFASSSLRDPEHRERVFMDARSIDGQVSSDPVIPATFHDSSQECLPFSRTDHLVDSDDRLGVANSTANEQRFTLQDDELVYECGNIVEEDETPEEQLLKELKFSQRALGGDAVSPSTSSTSGHRTPKLPTDSSPTKYMLRSVSSLLGSPITPDLASSKHPLSDIRAENGTTSSPPVKTISWQERDCYKSRLGKSGGRQFAKSLPTKSSQTQSGFRNTDDWSRIARHSFHDNDPCLLQDSFEPGTSELVSPVEEESIFRNTSALAKANYQTFLKRCSTPVPESLVVQIAQSQQNSTSDQRSPAHPLIGAILSHSFNNLIQSSVPESSEQASNAGHRSEEVAIITDGITSLPSFLDQSQTSVARARLRTVLLSSDLEEVAQSLRPQTLAQQDSQEEKPRKIVCLSSDLGDGDIRGHKREEACLTKNVLAEGHVANDQQIMNIPEQEDIPEQAASNESETNVGPSEPTAFDKFKAIYPSYSGEEKKFISALVYIEWLVETKGEHFLRASLWDDFVRSLAAEHLEYVQQSRNSGERIMTGFEHFNMLDRIPMFQQRFLTPNNLHGFLSTFDPAKVNRFRLAFYKPTAPLQDHSPPSHGPPFVASKVSQSDLSQQRATASGLIETAQPSVPNIAPESRFSEPLTNFSTKRPFFETVSQVQATKKLRMSVSPEERDVAEASYASKSRRSLPWVNGTASPSSPLPNPPSSVSVLASPTSSRVYTTSIIPKSKRVLSASISPHVCSFASPASPLLGKPDPRSLSLNSEDLLANLGQRCITSTSINRESEGSPILGKTTFNSHSHDVHDITAVCVGSSALVKKSKPPVSKATLMHHSKLPRSSSRRVEGWLEDTESETSLASGSSIVTSKALRPKESIKSKRDNGLELLNLQSLDAETKSRRVPATVDRAVASSLRSVLSDALSSTTASGRKPSLSYEDFLAKKRRESAPPTELSTPDTKPAGANGIMKRLHFSSTKHAEPETQAWSA